MSCYYEMHMFFDPETDFFHEWDSTWKRYSFDTFPAYCHAMDIMTERRKVQRLQLAEDQNMIRAGYYYEFLRESDGSIGFYSVTPHFREKVPFSNICDYFRKPVYRRSSNV